MNDSISGPFQAEHELVHEQQLGFYAAGYPGDVSVTATYSLPSATSLGLDMEACPENKATPISLAQHTYWNLAGRNSGNVLEHSILIWARHITPVDEYTVPTGEIIPVEGTPFDCTRGRKIGSRINQVPGPGLQFYTGNYVNGVAGKGGAVYTKHAGVCLETQGFTNAVNQPNFPSVVVQPGEEYKLTMLFEFTVE